MSPNAPSLAVREIRRRKRGSALLIVLAMVVLLTGLIVTFLFRTGNGVSISGNSANTTRADLFGQGAIDTTIGDLQQEIVAGSSTPAATSGNYGGNTVYMPTNATNMMAQVALPSGVTTTAFPNLVKMSVPGIPFSAGDTSNSGQGRAAGAVKGVGLTTTASANGALISLSSWNKPLLLPKASPSDTYNFSPASGFVAPNWILVARDGSNPTAWNASMQSVLANVSKTTPVVGRYAYMIYNEGGLLDANVVGSPPTGAGATVTYSSMAAYKNALAYADLTQLQDSSGNQLLTGADINALVGWRNYATAQVTNGNFPASSGSVPNYTFPTQSSATPTAFDYAMLFNPTGFLRTANSALLNSQSDRMFIGRQNLIHFLEAIDSSNLANMQNVLQYLGTFSRGLSQPSYASPTSLNIGAPTVVSGGTGANDASKDGTDAVINPSFLTVRAQTAFTRNDGSIAVVNEPLAKKKFALNRLAWLTYSGPSALRNYQAPSSTAGNSDYDLYQLENQYGIPKSFLAQGTAQNIYNYFGLSWIADPNNGGSFEWVYSHTGTTPLAGSGGASSARINVLQNISGREPDFFELLKAGICVGSIGKPYTESGAPTYQTQRDQSVDGAILQIGANIISQSQPSGYPARILANTGVFAALQEYRGEVDLPYIYRIRESKIRSLTDSSPTTYTSLPVTFVPTAAKPTPSGIGYELQVPEIWNPHAWRSAADANPRPILFRVVAVNADPNGTAYPKISLSGAWRPYAVGTTYTSVDDSNALTPTPLALTTANTALEFTIGAVGSGNALFREPTLLNKANIPTGSSMGIVGSVYNSFDKSPAYTSLGLTDTQKYYGISLGSVPLAWVETLPVGAIDGTNPTAAGTKTYAVPAEWTQVVSGTYVTYALQFRDAHNNWITYDQKFSPLVWASSYNTWKSASAGYGWTFNGTQIVSTELLATCFDPRTSRFGMLQAGPNGLRGNTSEYIPPYPVSGGGAGLYAWASKSSSPLDSTSNVAAAGQNALWTMRLDENQGFILDSTSLFNGFGYNTGPTAAGWSPAGSTSIVRPGLYAQNNPEALGAASTLRYAGDANGPGAPGLSCFADPDGVVRRGMAAYVPPSTTPASTAPFSAGAASSIPLKPAYTFSAGGAITATADAASRPVILNRPFRSVAELGYVFSDTPWRNLDFSTPESGNAALLDLFCINDTEDPNGLVAGKVDLNTRQAPVLQAILAGAYEDEFSASAATSSSTTSTVATPVLGGGVSATANKVAAGLVSRTGLATTPGGPLTNISELVGKWNSSVPVGGLIDGSQSYTGFSGTAATSSGPASSPPNLSYILTQDASAPSTVVSNNANYVQRYREATIRALSSNGQVRVWNLMIDLVAQTGRYPATAGNLDQFVVEGQQRFWVHLAIDRLTGKVIDKQVEVIKE